MHLAKIRYKINIAILVCLTIQIFSASFSIAVSSISFGVWGGLWLFEIFFLDRKLIYDKDTFGELKWINIFIGLYIFIDILSRVFAFYPQDALIGAKRNLLFLIFFICMMKIYDKKILFKLLVAVLVIQALISTGELIKYFLTIGGGVESKDFGEIRIDYLAYPLTSGEIKMLIFFLFFPLIFLKEKISFIDKRVMMGLLVPVFVSMLFTQSRNVFLGIFFCMLITGIVINRKFLIAFLAVIILGGLLLPPKYTARVKSIIDTNHNSNAPRLTMWENGWRMFVNNPVLGVGDNKLMEVYQYYRPEMTPNEHSHLHSNIFMILATNGIFGFLAWVTFFFLIFLKLLKFYRMNLSMENKLLIFGSILILISFHISGIFEWSFGDAEVFSVLFFLLSVPFNIYKFNISSTFKSYIYN
ncbi:MAG: O-antigen ligase family protein [Ignavibacteria bacterium]|nr:O-antigen ligase family protein [Ignavibacteria bacterium]